METSIINILSKPLSQRKEIYGTTDIQKLIIDGNVFTGYKTFSSHWEKTYIEQPERSTSGVIDNLEDHATFTTFIVKVNFAMMSIDNYRRLYDLMLSKNEFLVTAYDVLTNETITQKMYFAPDQMPKLYAMARNLQGSKFVEVLGIQDYTIELIGTNADLEAINIIYYDFDGSRLQGSQVVYANDTYTLAKGISQPTNGFDGVYWTKIGDEKNLRYATNYTLTANLFTEEEITSKTIKWKANNRNP